jgi:poly(3-hydroxybutyrate) depolymerase
MLKARMLQLCAALTLLIPAAVMGTTADTPDVEQSRSYTLVVEGYDWGPAVSRVILPLDETLSTVDPADFTVMARRSSDCTEITGEAASGERDVVYAYVSDAQGKQVESGTHVTLVLFVSPNLALGSPFVYVRYGKCTGNNWVEYRVVVTRNSDGRLWDQLSGRLSPPADRFDLTERFTYDESLSMSYAWYEPEKKQEKSPLLIWLHGGGEGGTDPSVPLLANRAANYASDGIQGIFKGAYVLVPQCPGAWMHNTKGVMTHGAEDDVYHEGLMELIRTFVARHPDIDADRIYVGGCSNGGYMSLKLILLHPGYFAAGFISALAYQSQYISDAMIKSIRNVPIWFVHAADDQTTEPDLTVLPVYKRLIAAGAKNVHLSYYDHVVDITGFYGGNDHHYVGHWSWVYCHANACWQDFDGSPVEVDGRPVHIMEWLAAQKR